MKISILLGPKEKSPLPPLELTLQVEKHSLAKRWSKGLKKILKKGIFLEKHYTHMGFPQAQRGLKEIANDMNKTVEIINAFSWPKPYFIKERAKEMMNQEDLNALHHHFEILTGLTWEPSEWFEMADQETRVAILFLNHYIHEYEYKYRSYEQKEKWGKAPSSLNFAFSASPHYDLKDEDCSHFSMERKFGDVYLHYSQLGKTFEEAFADNDDIVGDKNINGHRYYTGEFDLYLGPDTDPTYLADHKKRMEEWLKSKGVNPSDPRLCLGEARVARLIPSPTQLDWDMEQFQKEIGSRENVISITLQGPLRKYSRQYPYLPQESAKNMIEYFDKLI